MPFASRHDEQEAWRSSDLIFSTASVPVDKVLGSIKKDTLSIRNRFLSIEKDAAFIDRLAQELGLPVISNERCGSWYVRPSIKAGSAYFKSTDGHYGQWQFSFRRLNTHIFPIIAEGGGAIIVDSTRQGKHLPDAFARTIPIWCAVMNRLLFPDKPGSHVLVTPREIVSDSEHAQISSRIDYFIKTAKSLDMDIDELQAKLRKPVIPRWTSQSKGFTPSSDLNEEDFWVLHCAMASQYQPAGNVQSYNGYVQGSGDDAEFWAEGITPQLFWQHERDLLLADDDDELRELIAQLLRAEAVAHDSTKPVVIAQAPWLRIGKLQSANALVTTQCSALMACSPDPDPDVKAILKSRYLHLRCGQKKDGSRDLREQLELVPDFIRSLPSDMEIDVCCSTGQDLSVGVALAILSSFSDDTGK